jgi:hypothetical protein
MGNLTEEAERAGKTCHGKPLLQTKWIELPRPEARGFVKGPGRIKPHQIVVAF